MNEILGEETVDMSPADAATLEIRQGQMVRVRSRRGEVTVKAYVTDRVPRGMVWMAFHFREANANWLTNPVFDPVTLTAEYKACAVRVEKIASRCNRDPAPGQQTFRDAEGAVSYGA